MIKAFSILAALALSSFANAEISSVDSFYESKTVVSNSKARQRNEARSEATYERNEIIKAAQKSCLENDGEFDVRRKWVSVRKIGLSYYGKASAKVSCK
jgi:hypothetical protein